MLDNRDIERFKNFRQYYKSCEILNVIGVSSAEADMI